jgi:hypothetical protein
MLLKVPRRHFKKHSWSKKVFWVVGLGKACLLLGLTTFGDFQVTFDFEEEN